MPTCCGIASSETYNARRRPYLQKMSDVESQNLVVRINLPAADEYDPAMQGKHLASARRHAAVVSNRQSDITLGPL